MRPPITPRSRGGVSAWRSGASASRPTAPSILSSTVRELSIVGEGEWAAVKHDRRGKRGWKKLHLGVDRSGAIVAHALTESTVDDATTGIRFARGGRRRHRTRHGGRGLRHGRLLRGGEGTWRDRRGPTGQDGPSVSTETTVGRSRSDHHGGEGDRTASMEEGVGLPPAGAGGERLLSVQIDHRRRSASSAAGRTADRDRPRVQHSQSDDGAWQASVVQHWSLRRAWVGWLRVSVESCTNACAGKARSRGTRCRDVIFETLFETLWVSNPIRPRSAASRNRVMRGPGVTQGAKRSQGACRPRD